MNDRNRSDALPLIHFALFSLNFALITMAEGKWMPGLAPGMPVVDAARVVLAARFEVVRHFLPLAADRAFEDSEYVHQLRVSTRRAGAAIRVFGDCLPRKHLRAARRHLRTIRRAASDARDWDVFIIGMTKYDQGAGPESEPALDFLTGYALGERSAAQTRLNQVATEIGPVFAPRSAVLPAHVRQPRGDHAPLTLGDLAAAHLGALVRAFNATVEANPTGLAELHQLRIHAKDIRYAMEIFAGCFAPPLREQFYPAIESLQEILGDVQDAVVGTTRLEGLQALLKAMIPAGWPRLEPGIEAMLRELGEKVPAGREQFAAWCAEWAGLNRELSLDGLRFAERPA